MDNVLLPICEFPNSVTDIVGVCIQKTDSENGAHVGLLYPREGEVSNFIHLAFHLYLFDQTISEIENQNYFWIKLNIDEYLVLSVITSISRIYNNSKLHKIPYGLYYSNSKFNTDGHLILGKAETGLTCGTFVLAALELAGVVLLDLDTWQERDDDIIRHEKLLQTLVSYKQHYLEKGIDINPHIENVEKEVRCRRYRPEEVAAGAVFDNHPVGFEECSKLGKQIIDALPVPTEVS